MYNFKIRNKKNKYFYIRRVLYSVIFLLFFSFFFLYLYSFNLKFSSLILLLAFIILFVPIFFVDDLFHPFYIFITIQILPLINFLEKDMTRLPFRYGNFISGIHYEYSLLYSLLIIIVWFSLLNLGIKFSLRIKSNLYKRFINVDINRPTLLGGIILAISGLTYLYILYDVGGYFAIIDAMKYRTTLYAGKAYLLNIVQLGTIGSILLLYGNRKKISIFTLFLTFFAMSSFGSREGAFFGVIFPYLIFYNYFVKKISFIKMTYIMLPAIIFVIVWGNLRQYGVLGLMNTKLDDLLFVVARGKATADILPPLVWKLINGDIEFKLGKTLINIFYAPIPRGIWPNKPLIDETGIVGYELMGVDHWGLPARAYGIAFLNFHWIGIIVFSLFTGIIVGIFYKNLIMSKDKLGKYNVWLSLLYSLTIRNMFNIISTSAQIKIIWNIAIVFILYVSNKNMKNTNN